MPHWPIISEHLILFYISLHFLICLAGSSCTFPILVQESAISPVTLVFLLWEMILQINIHAINEFYTNIHCYWKIIALSLEIKDVCEYTLIHLHREILKKTTKILHVCLMCPKYTNMYVHECRCGWAWATACMWPQRTASSITPTFRFI